MKAPTITHYRDPAYFNKVIAAEGIPSEFLPNLDDNDSTTSEAQSNKNAEEASEKESNSSEVVEKSETGKKSAPKKLTWPLCCWICRHPITRKRSYITCGGTCRRSYHTRCHGFMRRHFQNVYEKLLSLRNDESSYQELIKSFSEVIAKEEEEENQVEQENDHKQTNGKEGGKENKKVQKTCFFCKISHIGCNGCRQFFREQDLVKCCVEDCTTFYCYPNCMAKTRMIIPDKKVIDINMSMCGHLHNLVDANGRPKFICHSHTCWSCYDSDRYAYYWEMFWRHEHTKEKNATLVSAWNSLKTSCRGKVESSHFAKGKKIAKPQRYPELRNFRSFVQSKPNLYQFKTKRDELYNSSDDDDDYFQKGPSTVLLKCVRCDRTWCTHCVHPDVHILPKSGKQIVCQDCIHIQLGCTLTQNSRDENNRENMLKKDCIYPSVKLDTGMTCEIYKQLKNFIIEHASYEKKLNLEPSFITKQPAQDSDEDTQILDLHRTSSKSKKTKKPDSKEKKVVKNGQTSEGKEGKLTTKEITKHLSDIKSREWSHILKGSDQEVLTKISSDFKYITSNLVHPEYRKLISAPEPDARCHCTKRCGPECQNVQKNVECHTRNCGLHEVNCGNRKFANFGEPKLKLNYVKGKGVGAVTTEDIQENELVCEYVGEVITHSDFQKALPSSSFAEIDDDNKCHWYIMRINKEMYIDSTYMGNVSRFINHSCDPNCATIPINVKGIYRMGVFAQRKIKRGEEVTYNYGFTSKGVGGGFRCKCNSNNCRGIIGTQLTHSPESIMNIEMIKNSGAEQDVLAQLTSDMSSLSVANKRESLKQQPSPLDVLNGIWTVGDLHRYEKILKKLDKNEMSKSFVSKFSRVPKGSKNPLVNLLEDNSHVSEAQFNYVKMLTLNSMSMLQFDLSNTKKFATNIPWAIVAMGHKDLSPNVSMETSTGFFEFYPLAKKFIQISTMLMAKKMYGKAACENIQDLMDLTWGGTEPCSGCGGYGDCRWCDGCGDVLHDDNNCGDFYINKKEENLCTVCQNSDHRYEWYVGTKENRERIGMELWSIRMKRKVDYHYELLKRLCYKNEYVERNGKEEDEEEKEKEMNEIERNELYIDEKRLMCTEEELKLLRLDQKMYYEEQERIKNQCYEAMMTYECYTLIFRLLLGAVYYNINLSFYRTENEDKHLISHVAGVSNYADTVAVTHNYESRGLDGEQGKHLASVVMNNINLHAMKVMHNPFNIYNCYIILFSSILAFFCKTLLFSSFLWISFLRRPVMTKFLNCSTKSNIFDLLIVYYFLRDYNKASTSVSSSRLPSNFVSLCSEVILRSNAHLYILESNVVIRDLSKYVYRSMEILEILESGTKNCCCVCCFKCKEKEVKNNKSTRSRETLVNLNYVDTKIMSFYNKGNHLCLCLIVNYVLANCILACITYLRDMDMDILSAIYRFYHKYTHSTTQVMSIGKMIIMILSIIYRITLWMKYNYLCTCLPDCPCCCPKKSETTCSCKCLVCRQPPVPCCVCTKEKMSCPGSQNTSNCCCKCKNGQPVRTCCSQGCKENNCCRCCCNCFCKNVNDPYYPYLVSILLWVSSMIENIWAMDNSIETAIQSLSSLLSEYQWIHLYPNYYSLPSCRIYPLITNKECNSKKKEKEKCCCWCVTLANLIVGCVSLCVQINFYKAIKKQENCDKIKEFCTIETAECTCKCPEPKKGLCCLLKLGLCSQPCNTEEIQKVLKTCCEECQTQGGSCKTIMEKIESGQADLLVIGCNCKCEADAKDIKTWCALFNNPCGRSAAVVIACRCEKPDKCCCLYESIEKLKDKLKTLCQNSECKCQELQTSLDSICNASCCGGESQCPCTNLKDQLKKICNGGSGDCLCNKIDKLKDLCKSPDCTCKKSQECFRCVCGEGSCDGEGE